MTECSVTTGAIALGCDKWWPGMMFLHNLQGERIPSTNAAPRPPAFGCCKHVRDWGSHAMIWPDDGKMVSQTHAGVPHGRWRSVLWQLPR